MKHLDRSAKAGFAGLLILTAWLALQPPHATETGPRLYNIVLQLDGLINLSAQHGHFLRKTTL